MVDKKETLSNNVNKVFIISNKLPTDKLQHIFKEEGLKTEELRQKRKIEYESYSLAYLAFLNHKKAWERTLGSDKFTLIVEEDFIPVVNFGRLPMPFNPEKSNFGICWLYNCGPEIYSISKEGYINGGSTSMVAYLINSESAKLLIEFAKEIEKKVKPDKYYPWDPEIGGFFISNKRKN